MISVSWLFMMHLMLLQWLTCDTHLLFAAWRP